MAAGPRSEGATVGPVVAGPPVAKSLPMSDNDRPIALVTGASRGVGAGIARALGEAGAVVYVTGRSTRAAPRSDGLTGTIEETAEAVTAAGGEGIALACDHHDEAAAQAQMRRIAGERHRLDVLVNNAWGGYERNTGDGSFAAPFQGLPTHFWADMFEGALKPAFLTTRHALPLMTTPRPVDAPPRTIVNVVAWAFGEYLGNLWYDVAKAAAIRMIEGLARETAPADITCVALAPGFVRTERVERALAGDATKLAATESALYAGRAVAALACDPDALERSGKLVTAAELARDYGFTDGDERQPPPFRFG